MSKTPFSERLSDFEFYLKKLLTTYKMRIVTFIETEEVNGVVTAIKPIIYFIDDSLSYEKEPSKIN